MFIRVSVCLAVAIPAALAAQGASVRVGSFRMEVAKSFGTADGLASSDVRAIAVLPNGNVYAGTADGLYRLQGARFERVAGTEGTPVRYLAAGDDTVWFAQGADLMKFEAGDAQRIAGLPGQDVSALAAGPQLYAAADGRLYRFSKGEWLRVARIGDPPDPVRRIAVGIDGSLALATQNSLLLRDAEGRVHSLHPAEGNRSWAPHDVRTVAFDHANLWFASPQGAGHGLRTWALFTPEDGLPYDDFTAAAAEGDGAVWFGTHRGAIRFDGHAWEYRQGLRWLPDDDVRDIAVDSAGTAWIATAKGIGRIERRLITLQEKARLFEEAIDQRHRRTPYGYVESVRLKRPGDLSEWTQQDSDNDGLWTSMYGAGECFAYAGTHDPGAKKRAKAAFEALRFLRLVTQGGTPPAPAGFFARAVLPASGLNPNQGGYTREHDEEERRTRDGLWKVMVPRWPLSADGKWYWKSDTSSDELDGHFFFYGVYFDLVAESAEEKAEVREHVAAIAQHLVDHNFQFVDHDGLPTRWGIFDPAHLNQDPVWWEDRGLNSASILSYLLVAQHITGDTKFGEAARRLIDQHGYAQNALIPKTNAGPGSGNQSDDEMAFMDFYHLVRYENDPVLRQMFSLAFYRRWMIEEPELNPLFNFLYAGVCANSRYRDATDSVDLAPVGDWLEQSIDTLKRYPLDRVDWRLDNSHRKDVVRVPAYVGDPAHRGMRRNGRVLPIDERFVDKWNHDPWELNQGGNGLSLADGASFLLPYYLGLYTGYLRD